MSQSAAARKHGVSVTTVWRALRQDGLLRRPAPETIRGHVGKDGITIERMGKKTKGMGGKVY